jgi:hypothetical protein
MSMPQSQSEGDQPPIDPSLGTLRYFAAYEYVFQNANWLSNLLLGTLCQIIPVVGPIVFMGYQYEIIEALHRDPRRVYPDFNFNRFADYLVRGVWPFLVSLVAGMVLAAIMMVPMFLFQILIAASDHKHAGPLAVVVMILMFFVMIVFQFGFYLLLLPLTLRAGLSQDFVKAFDFEFLRDFVGRMWLEMLFVALFLWASTFVLMIGGFMLCCVGVFPAATLALFANAHLLHQLYEVYLFRGGQPIPLKAPASATVTT